MKISIPYGKTFLSWEGELPSYEILSAHQTENHQEQSEEALVTEALAHPICSRSLADLAKGKKTAVVIISDHTRPVPSKIILPPMLKAIRDGAPDIQITLLVATGCHRGTNEAELRAKLGDAFYEQEKIVVHDCDDEQNMVDIGILPSGIHCWVNRIAAEAELLVSEGFIEPHFFAGFSGGRKSVLPGVCARRTVMANHCAKLIDDPCSRMGILEHNRIHEDMVAAAQMIGLEFIVNIVLDSQKHVIYAVAGNAVEAHVQGCRFVERQCVVTPRKKGNLVITSNGGAPLDQNIYQSVKCMATAEAAAAPGAIMIICCECADGIGGKAFFDQVSKCTDVPQMLEQIRRVEPEQTPPDQWQYQILARIMEKHQVYFVTRPELKDTITQMKMRYFGRLEEAMSQAKPDKKHVLLIPEGISVMIR